MCPLFETIKIENRKIQNVAFHNERLNRSRKQLFAIDEKLKLEDLIDLPSNLGDEIYKCRVKYGREVGHIEFEKYFPKSIKSLKLVACNDIDYAHKYLDRSKINALFEQRGDCDDILIIKNGLVTDTSYANIVFWDGVQWITPMNPLLAGTARARLMAFKEIVAKPIKLEDLKQFKKARIINAMMKLSDSMDIQKFE